MLFSKGIGLGFNTFMTAAEPEASLLAGIKPSPRIKPRTTTAKNLSPVLVKVFRQGG
jgi:hypothetical protein